MSNPVAVHSGSVIAGVRMACVAIKGTMPDQATVDHILAQGKGHVELHEFPFEVISQAAMARKERRRTSAFKALEAFLHHAGDPLLLRDADLDKLVTKAWHVAALMESQDDVASQLDSLGKSSP